MCKNKEHNCLTFIDGEFKYLEDDFDASYRTLYEKTGIYQDDIILNFVEQTSFTSKLSSLGTRSVFVTAGILHEDITLKSSGEELVWLDVLDPKIITDGYGYGECYMFMRRAIELFLELKGSV